MDISSPSSPASLPLPVTLSLELPPGPRQEPPVLTIPCAPTAPERSAGISWSELLGER